MSNLEVVALSLTAEYMSMDSENSLFEKIDDSVIENLLERSQFNKRHRVLFELHETVRKKLASYFLEFENCFLIDSMPLEICKIARHQRVKICKEEFENSQLKVTVPHRRLGSLIISYMLFVLYLVYFIHWILLRQTCMIYVC